MEYFGTENLILVKRNININSSGIYVCNSEYSCRNSSLEYWANKLVRGNSLPGMPQFIIDNDVNIDIGQNGFATFRLSGYSEVLGPISTATQFR